MRGAKSEPRGDEKEVRERAAGAAGAAGSRSGRRGRGEGAHLQRAFADRRVEPRLADVLLRLLYGQEEQEMMEDRWMDRRNARLQRLSRLSRDS